MGENAKGRVPQTKAFVGRRKKVRPTRFSDFQCRGQRLGLARFFLFFSVILEDPFERQSNDARHTRSTCQSISQRNSYLDHRTFSPAQRVTQMILTSWC
jgi:hypothetical protein